MGDDGQHDGDDDRDAILARRRRFVALALSGLTTAGTVGVAGCYESHELDGRVPPRSCLSMLRDAGHDAGEPMPCLSAPRDAGWDAGEPMPCLDIAPMDAGPDDASMEEAGPAVCLSMASLDADHADDGSGEQA